MVGRVRRGILQATGNAEQLICQAEKLVGDLQNLLDAFRADGKVTVVIHIPHTVPFLPTELTLDIRLPK